MEHMSKTSEDVSEVVLDQPEEEAGALGDTEPYHGPSLGQWKSTGRSRRGWVPLLVDWKRMLPSVTFGSEVASGTATATRGGGADVTTKGTTQERGSPTEGISGHDGWNGVGPWGPGGPADGRGWSEPTERRVTCSGIGKYSVTNAARSRGPADRKPILEDAESTDARAYVRQAALTTTKVPWFNGSTSWEQYQQVFDAIVLSNGWGDATAALQLLSHLQDEALSVALLLPMPLRASRRELTDALSSHYGSPGRLANYRREFDKTVRKPGEDPSNFAIALETLAVKAFGDMGQTIRLRLIRDRFIAGHESNSTNSNRGKTRKFSRSRQRAA